MNVPHRYVCVTSHMSSPEQPKRTGLICHACRKPIAIVARVGPEGLALRCPGCGHKWEVSGEHYGHPGVDHTCPNCSSTGRLTRIINADLHFVCDWCAHEWTVTDPDNPSVTSPLRPRRVT